MSNALAIQNEFLAIHASLNNFVDGLESYIQSFNQNSQKIYGQYKDRFYDRLNEWQNIIENSKTLLKTFPKEIRKRDMIHSLMTELEKCESAAKGYIKNLSQMSLDDYKSSVKVKADALCMYFKNLKEEAQTISIHFTLVQQNSIIQKWIDGHKILASRHHFQWGRKLFHVANGLIAVSLYGILDVSKTVCITLLSAYVLMAITTEVTRRYSSKFNDFIYRSFAGIMREREKTSISAATWYATSVLIILILFPKNIVLLSVLFVALGDTAAGIVGTSCGKHKISKHVSLEGFLACFIVCALSTYFYIDLFMNDMPLAGLHLFDFALLAGLIGAFSESILKRFDDNLIIPLVSAPLLWLLSKLFI